MEVTGPFRSELWPLTIFQVAQHVPPVKHALFALSSMHESYALPSESQYLLHQYVMYHYNEALRQVVKISQPEHSYNTLLLTCVMFCAIESLRGNFLQSLQHAHSGMKIIAQARVSSSTDQLLPRIAPETLAQTFLALQNQVMGLGDSSIFRVFDSLQQGLRFWPEDAEESHS